MIRNYFGIGMIIMLIGIALIVYAVIMMSRRREEQSKASITDMNRQFYMDTGRKLSDVDEGRFRKKVAADMHIGEEYKESERK